MIQFKKWTMDCNGEFLRRRIKVIKKYLKNCPRSLAIRERQIKFLGGFILPQSEGPRSTKQPTNAGGDLGRREPSFTGSAKCCSHWEYQFKDSLQVKIRSITWPSNTFTGHLPKGVTILLQRYLLSCAHGLSLYSHRLGVGNNLDAFQLMNGQCKCGLHAQWNSIQL